jgi:hypothetical protein
MSEIAPRFDYEQLDCTTQDALREYADHLVKLTHNSAENLWHMGRILAEAQDRLASHKTGTFGQWVEGTTGLSLRTAYRLIYVHRAFNLANLARITAASSALYLLAEPSTPPEAREEALARAESGETITHATAQQIVQSYRPEPPPVPRPPERPSAEYAEFEKTALMPRLSDAGLDAAPQVLSGSQQDPQSVSAEQRERGAQGLREAVVEAIGDIQTGDEQDIEERVDRVLVALGQGTNSIAIAARFGVALARNPQTLADLTAITIHTCGICTDGMTRDEYLRQRKRTLRLLDAISYSGGLGVYEHTLENGQICFSLV